jgi:uncharacterized protein involved in tellurium resistance
MQRLEVSGAVRHIYIYIYIYICVYIYIYVIRRLKVNYTQSLARGKQLTNSKGHRIICTVGSLTVLQKNIKIPL